MNELDIRVSGSRLAALAEQQTAIARGVGYEVMKFKSAYGHIPGWMKQLKDRCPELDDFSPSEVGLFMRAAEAYTSEEWDYKLPWCMYAYAVRHTSDPAGWIRMAVDNGWKYSEFRAEIRESKPANEEMVDTDDLPPTLIFETCVPDDRDLGFIAAIKVYVDIEDRDLEPVAVVELMRSDLSPAAITALRRSLQLTEQEIQSYLGACGLTVTGVTDEVPAAA